MTTVTTKDGFKLEVVKVYSKEERFFGKVLVRFEGFKTSSKFEINYFNSIVEDKDKI
jgi:hypothetical protein